MSNVQNLFSQPSFPLPYPGQSFFGTGNIQVFSSSGTFVVPPSVTRIRVRVWGGGGSGGIAVTAANNKAASGGGGGGHCIKVIDTTPGTSYTVTVGAGGARVNGGSVQAGNAGGTSSFSTICSATGGGAGQAGSSGSGTATAAGATGGTATGGDVNYSGGGSGAVSITQYSASFKRIGASGGGSSGSIFGNGYSSGSVTMSISGIGADTVCVSGGGGVGGSSGNASHLSTAYTFWATGGGGTFGPSANSSSASTSGMTIGGAGFILPRPANEDAAGSALQSAFLSMPNEFFNSFAANSAQTGLASTIGSQANQIGSYPFNCVNRFPGDILIAAANSPNGTTAGNNPTAFSAPGAGGSPINGSAITPSVAGPLSGGAPAGDGSNNTLRAQNGSVAGGGGGCAGFSGTDSASFSGSGGTGMVVVEW